MKKLICLLLVAMMVFAFVGCAKEEAPAAEAPAAEEAPAEEAAPEKEEAAPEKEEAAPENAAGEKEAEAQPVIDIPYGPTEGKTDDDYYFGFSFGGINPYADPVEPAATVAEKELGINKHMTISTPQDWIQNDQNQLLDAMIAGGVKGIQMMPSEATASNEQITKMVNAGIPVVCMGGPPALPCYRRLSVRLRRHNRCYRKDGQEG